MAIQLKEGPGREEAKELNPVEAGMVHEQEQPLDCQKVWHPNATDIYTGGGRYLVVLGGVVVACLLACYLALHPPVGPHPFCL